MNYEDLMPYVKTSTQKKHLQAVIQYGSCRKAAKSLEVSKTAVTKAIIRIKKNAAKKGFSPDHDMKHISAPGFNVKGVSTLYNADGDVSCQWVKTDRERSEQEEVFRDFIEGLSSGIRGKSKTTEPTNTKYDPDLMSAIIIGDAHIGMLAHKKETLIEDFDTDIAIKELKIAIDNLISRSPNSETGVLVDVGDFVHSNSSKNETFNGTSLDCDTRHSKVMLLSGMLMRYAVDNMLKKFKNVIVVIAQGNHDPEPSVAISLMLKFYYENNNRVDVKSTVGKFHYLEHGINLIGVTHGDGIKPEKLVSMMAATHPSWSSAKNRMWWTGHFHTKKVNELDGCCVHIFGTLAPPDKWSASHGFVGSKKTMSMIVLHKKHGLESTIEYNLLMSEIKNK